MRSLQGILTALATLVAGGCANGDAEESPYDEVARIVGADLTTPDGGGELGAFADSVRLARDQLPDGFVRSGLVVEGKHGEFTHRYGVVCVDEKGVAIERCGPAAARALVFASWDGPLDTGTHEGRLRRGGFWSIPGPGDAMATLAGNTWLEYDAGAYRIEDERSMMLVVEMSYPVVTGGGMNGTLRRYDGADTQSIRTNISLTATTATITLDGVHTTDVNVSPILIR